MKLILNVIYNYRGKFLDEKSQCDEIVLGIEAFACYDVIPFTAIFKIVVYEPHIRRHIFKVETD